MKTQPTGPFLGINNRLPDFALTTENGRWLRSAENVEITNSGNIVRRQALELIQAMTGAHSLHGDLLVRDSMLYKVTLPAYSETLVKVLTSDEPMSYVDFNGYTYYSNGSDAGKVDSSGAWSPMAMATPVAPTVSTISGTLFEGAYQVAVSYVNSAAFEESGVSASASISLATSGGFRVTLPVSTAGATHINVYLTTVNGAIPFLHSTVAVGTPTIDLTVPATGREANQRYEEPLPAGTKLFMFNGRLCSCSGNTLYYGLPHRFGYYVPISKTSPEGGRITFPAPITVAVGNQFGCYVVADKTYWLQGQDLNAVEVVRTVFHYGAVHGTEFQVPGTTTVGWFGEKGIVLADNQGQAEAIMESAVDAVVPESGLSVVLQDRGYDRVVSCGYCVNIENKAVTTYAGWPVTSSSETYCTTDDGIYSMDGAGQANATVVFGKENFGSNQLKNFPNCYLGVASETPMVLRMTLPTGDYYDYDARSSSEELMIQRVDIGKGIRCNWVSPSLYNSEGADFALASIVFVVSESAREI